MDDDVTDQSPTRPSAQSDVDDALVRPGGALSSRYQLRRRLGRGATKDVYLVYDRRLDREVALALVVGAGGAIAGRARAIREAQVTGRLGDHANVVTVYDSGEADGIPYLVLRAMAGGSLADRIEHNRPDAAGVMALGSEIALALAHAHAHDVIHRDVKPDNVWLTSEGHAALGDFGIAHQTGQERLTAEGVVVGTVRYLSPEQILGRDVGPACDLYALGVTLYELVTGRAPFVAADATQLLAQHVTATPAAPSRYEPSVPGPLEDLILDLLAKEPAQRPRSAADVATALETMAASAARGTLGPGGARPRASRTSTVATAPPTVRRPDSRRLISVLAARADFADPEALHAVFERCTAVVERHGGTVERYLGDALVGLFGVDESYGDDALRAARAADELRAASGDLRLGIEAGEVFLGAGPNGATIVTGAPITAAVRLAERAGQGEILLGDAAARAVGAHASVDAPSGRLLALRAEQPALLRALGTPFVGRSGELDELRAAYEQARDERVCRMVTVAGAPGIGKSRLAGEFLASLGDEPIVLAGRCLAYGEGTTYRALADIVRGLGADPRGRLATLLADDEQALRGMLAAAGLSAEPAQADETAWATRRLLERLARDRPVVVAVEDIHWAEPALLDLLEHAVALTSEAPILLLCLTRPELLEARPRWAQPQPGHALIVLDALGEADARELAEQLGAPGLAQRIAERAEGNPLFVEQLVAVDAADGDELPASIHAVLAARIDRLGAAERMLLQRAAVEGRTFHRAALAALLPAPERGDLATTLGTLAQKGLVAGDQTEFPGEEAFRFSHALVRDVAYGTVPKLVRADLHADVARWLEQRPGAADEIVGFHFEQSCLLASELGRAGEREEALAEKAVARFEAASRAALARAAPSSASALLERAITLVGSDGAARGALLPALGASLFEAGELTAAARVLDEAIDRAPEPRLAARAQVEREFVRVETETGIATDRVREVADAVLPLLEREHDHQGQSRVWSLRAQVALNAGRVGAADDAWREAADCARRAGDERGMYDALSWRATAAVLGPAPVDEAIELCDAFRELVGSGPVAPAWMINPLASLHAMKGEFEIAERLLGEAEETLRELGHRDSIVSHHAALVRLLAGQPERAEPPLRAGLEKLAALEDGAMLATTAAMLAQAVYAQGRDGEAAELCELTAAAAPADDMITQAIWRGVKAKVLARAGDGDREQALALAHEAVALLEPTDLLSHRGDAMLDLAEVLHMCGRIDESRDAARIGLELYESKGNIAAAARTRELRWVRVHPDEG